MQTSRALLFANFAQPTPIQIRGKLPATSVTPTNTQVRFLRVGRVGGGAGTNNQGEKQEGNHPSGHAEDDSSREPLLLDAGRTLLIPTPPITPEAKVKSFTSSW